MNGKYPFDGCGREETKAEMGGGVYVSVCHITLLIIRQGCTYIHNAHAFWLALAENMHVVCIRRIMLTTTHNVDYVNHYA
jgi:hypothetical protein